MPRAAADQLRHWREHPAAMVRELFQVEPDAWQEEVLERFPSERRIAMKACKGPGKGLDKETIIPTPVGNRRFGDLVVGDLVFSANGSPTRVTAVYDLGLVPAYRVSFDDGAAAIACGDHLWQVKGATERRHKYCWTVLNTRALIERGVRVKNGRWAGRQFEIPRHGAVSFTAAALPVDPYVVGVWLGDGSGGKAAYSKPYPEIEEEINRRGYQTQRKRCKGRCDTIRVLNCGEAFAKLPCFGAGSPDRFIPPDYLRASIVQRTDLLRGLMDTDGCIGADSHMEYDTTSPRLAEEVVWLVRSLGGVAFRKQTIKRGWYRNGDGERVEGRDCYRVTLRTPFNPFLLPYKARRWRRADTPSRERYLKRYIDAIEPVGNVDCMCISVDHPHALYLANDFIVTHNTAVEAWLAWNFLLTRPHPKVAATSISEDNLRDNLWTEMSWWQAKSPLLKHAFTWTKSKIFANDHPETWWMAFRTWPKSADKTRQADTLAGLHADYILFILDESGGIPDAVMVSAEAALSSCKEGHIVQAGNPTTLEGPLYRACSSEKRLWYVVEITGDPDDPKRSPRISEKWAREQIEKYGRDSPWVLVNVFGRFPPASLNALIGPDEVAAAMRRHYRDYEIGNAAKVLGVDVARFGDDSSVIAKRQGIVLLPFAKYRDLDSTQGAGLVSRHWLDWGADACFVDATGGFGAGWIDQMQLLGRAPVGVTFSAHAHESARYVNKRAEMAFDFVHWIKQGGALPQSPELTAALTQTTYTFQGDRLLLEPKDEVKTKIGYSPDEFDGAILTFAEPVTPKVQSRFFERPRVAVDYDPFAKADLGAEIARSYDPFARI